MTLTVREMTAAETDLIIDYFQNSTPEHLETLGVDPTRLPPVQSWRERLQREATLPIDKRTVVLVIWLRDDRPIGLDRKSTRLNSSHTVISYAVFCLKKK